MGQKEKHIINRRIIDHSPNERLFRANCGRAWAGKIMNTKTMRLTAAKRILSGNNQSDRYMILEYPRVFHGLPKGFHDIFGFESIEITQDMVGTTVAVFKAIEVKTGDMSMTDEQRLFANTVKKFGGISEVLRECDTNNLTG